MQWQKVNRVINIEAPQQTIADLEQTADVMEEAAALAADALADAAGALVDETRPQHDRLASALEEASRSLYIAATLAGQLEAAGRGSAHGETYRTLRETAEGLRAHAETRAVSDLRRVIAASLRLLEGALEPDPNDLGQRAQDLLRQAAQNEAPDAANDNRPPPMKRERR